MELMETSTTSHWVLRYNCRFTMPTDVTRSHSCLPDTPLDGTLWGSSWAQSELLHFASQKRMSPSQPQLLSADLTIPAALWGCEDHGGATVVTWGRVHLWGSEWGWGWDREERRSDSEWCCWNCSQLITHETGSPLTQLCSLIFHIVLFTAPSACPTKVKWRERWHAHHTQIY